MKILIASIVDPESALEEVFKSACERIIEQSYLR
jgi:hypothetical protein